MVLYSRDHKGRGPGKTTKKLASLFPDDDEAVLVRPEVHAQQ